MFNHEQIKKFTDVEMLIYNYVIQNSQNIRYMTIRELAMPFMSQLQLLCVFVRS